MCFFERCGPSVLGSRGSDKVIEPGNVATDALDSVLDDALCVVIEAVGPLGIAELLDELGSSALEQRQPCVWSKVSGEGPAQAEGALVVTARRGVEEGGEVGSTLVGDPIDLLRSPTTAGHEPTGPHGGPLPAQRPSGGRRRRLIIGLDYLHVSGCLEPSQCWVERAERDVGGKPHLGAKTTTDLVAMKGAIAEEAEDREVEHDSIISYRYSECAFLTEGDVRTAPH